MELLKVFVGDGSTASGTTVDTMIPGDLLIVDADTHTALTISNVAGKTIKIVSCINKNGVNTPVFSTPITRSNVKYIAASQDNENAIASPALAAVAEASATATVGATALAASTTYSIGVQIKEDLRMGTYNKNTEIIGSYTTPASIPSDGFVKMEMASTIAKGFAANPLTSAGSPYQLVNVYRKSPSTSFTGFVAAGQALTATRGSRVVTFTGALNAAVVAGVLLNLGTSWYLIEKVETGKITLDTAFQETTATIATGTGATQAYVVPVASFPTSFTFEFDAVAQTQKNRYDQFRMVDFVVITPKGNDAGLITISATAPVYPIGSYRQIRDLEEKAYTNSNPLINYREFPFETFPLNATPGTFYCTVALSYVSNWGYNVMQSNQSEFLQTVVIAAPFIADTGQFDVTPTPTGSVGHFLDILDAWLGTYTVSGWGSFTFLNA
jgi:hypothetical protein